MIRFPFFMLPSASTTEFGSRRKSTFISFLKVTAFSNATKPVYNLSMLQDHTAKVSVVFI